jgi:hypothetical protein
MWPNVYKKRPTYTAKEAYIHRPAGAEEDVQLEVQDRARGVVNWSASFLHIRHIIIHIRHIITHMWSTGVLPSVCAPRCQKRPIIRQKRPIIRQKRPIIRQTRPIDI